MTARRPTASLPFDAECVVKERAILRRKAGRKLLCDRDRGKDRILVRQRRTRTRTRGWLTTYAVSFASEFFSSSGWDALPYGVYETTIVTA